MGVLCLLLSTHQLIAQTDCEEIRIRVQFRFESDSIPASWNRTFEFFAAEPVVLDENLQAETTLPFTPNLQRCLEIIDLGEPAMLSPSCITLPDTCPEQALRLEVKVQLLRDHPEIFSTGIEAVKIVDWQGNSNRVPLDAASQGDRASLAPAFNQVPGIRWDERGNGGSRRLSIRGSLFRSPFGVRNLRMYTLGLPLSSPDGSSPLEVWDPIFIHAIDLYKGPVPWLGPGTGGGMRGNMRWMSPFSGNIWQGSAGISTGSFGLLQRRVRIMKKGPRYKFMLGYSGQNYQGYRELEGNRKDQVILASQWELGSYSSLELLTWYYDGRWELPGALTEDERNANPRQANPNSLPFQPFVDRRRARTLLRFHHRFSSRKHAEIGAYGNWTDKENPFGTSNFFQGYKDEAAAGTGWAGNFTWRSLNYKGTVSLSGEQQFEWQRFAESENVNGTASALRSRDRYRIQLSNWVALARYRMGRWGTFQGSLSLQNQSYRVQELFSSDTLDFSGNYSYRWQILPELLYEFESNIRGGFQQVLHLRARTGYSPPGLFELQQNRQLEQALEAETARMFEAEYILSKGHSLRRIEAQTAIYWTFLEDAILPEMEVGDLVSYANKGEVWMRGLEMRIRKIWRKRLPERRLELEGSLDARDYRFQNYEVNGENLRGNRLPGVAPWTIGTSIEAHNAKEWQVRLSGQYRAALFFDDLNTQMQDSYYQLDAWLGKTWYLRKDSDDQRIALPALRPHAGARNLLNAQYSAFPQLNGFGGRYFNPAPGTTWYLGCDLEF